ncbi:MAG: hypothetical protein RLZZ156_2410 [Deinococcota bacterium]|jgi:hypothetical protein
MLDCPTCGSYRSLVQYATGIQKRRFPRGQFVCQHDVQPWHLQLEILKREFDLTSSQALKNALLEGIEVIILEYCLVDSLEVA